jgi:hypothetical protein
VAPLIEVWIKRVNKVSKKRRKYGVPSNEDAISRKAVLLLNVSSAMSAIYSPSRVRVIAVARSPGGILETLVPERVDR